MPTSLSLDVILPTRNRAHPHGLPRALGALLEARASIPEGLVVRCTIVDNGSTDETKAVVERLAAQAGPDFFRYSFEPEPGRSSALNHGIRVTRGDWIAVFDDDEVVPPGCFALAYEWMQRPELDYFGGGYQPEWEIPEPPWFPKSWPGVVGRSAHPTEPFTKEGTAMLHGGNSWIKRSVLEEMGPYRTDLMRRDRRGRTFGYEDMDMFWRLLRAGKRGWYVRELSVLHWVPKQRMTKRYHRAWAWNQGIIRAAYDAGHPRPPELVYWGKIPRYMFSEAGKHLGRIREVGAQMFVLHFLGQLYGYYGPKRR